MSNSDWREKYRVRIGFFFGLIFIWRAQPRVLPFLALGLLVALAGVLLRQWAAGCLRKNDELAVAGPYALVRNPLYLGSFMAAAGFVFASSSLAAPLSRPFLDRTLFFWAFLWIMIDSVYAPKIRKEEKLLREKFGEQFEQYAKRVPALFPRKPGRSSFDFSTFNRDLWEKNAEYWSILGYIAIAAILVARYQYR